MKCHPSIAEARMDCIRCQDWPRGEANFVASNLIVIVDSMAQHDRLFEHSKRTRNKSTNKSNALSTCTGETSGDGEFCRRGDVCFGSPMGLGRRRILGLCFNGPILDENCC
jgi:hypothetical protein